MPKMVCTITNPQTDPISRKLLASLLNSRIMLVMPSPLSRSRITMG